MWRAKRVVKVKSNGYSDVDAYYEFYLPFLVVRLLILILQFMEGLIYYQGTNLWNNNNFSGIFFAYCELFQQERTISGHSVFVFNRFRSFFNLLLLLLFHKLVSFCYKLVLLNHSLRKF